MTVDVAKWRAELLADHPDFRPRLEWVEKRMSCCESDLERLFLILAAFKWRAFTNFSYAGEPPPGQPQVGNTFVIDFEQQVKIARYRCDFLLTVRFNDGQKNRRVAVECDGHSFHDRTAEQASRDRRRDRRLIAEGVPTLRYTFSDLTKEPNESMADLRQTMRAIVAEARGSEPPK